MDIPSEISDEQRAIVQFEKAKVDKQSGFINMGTSLRNDFCAFSDQPFTEAKGFQEFSSLLEMRDATSWGSESISCGEEERVKQGYQIQTFFNYHPQQGGVVQREWEHENTKALGARYIPSAKVIRINKGWASGKSEGFYLNLRDGSWVGETDYQKAKKDNNTEVLDSLSNVQLYTESIMDCLFIDTTCTGLQKVGVITLMFALKKAIQEEFNVEEQELAAVPIGLNETPNVLLYEAAEGSLGVLSQVLKDDATFKRLIHRAYAICNFEADTTEAKTRGSYSDLLDYYNQAYHRLINKQEIREFLDLLKDARFVQKSPSGITVEEQEAKKTKLLQQLPPNRERATGFISDLCDAGLQLPDSWFPYEQSGISVALYHHQQCAVIISENKPLDNETTYQLVGSELYEQLDNKGIDHREWFGAPPALDFANQHPDLFLPH